MCDEDKFRETQVRHKVACKVVGAGFVGITGVEDTWKGNFVTWKIICHAI
jgi:hypothetical protein